MVATNVTLKEEISDFHLLSGLKTLKEPPFCWSIGLFSSLLSLMSTILLLFLQPGVTDVSQRFAVIAQLRETIFKMNISPLLLEFNCTGSQRCGFMSGANIGLSQLISREGQLQLRSRRCALIFKSETSFSAQKWILLKAHRILLHVNN